MFKRRITVMLCALTIAVMHVVAASPVLAANVIVADTHLPSPDDSGQPHFGASVAIDGDVAVVGAPKDSGGPSGFVGAYVYVRNSSGWGTATPLEITTSGPSDPPLVGASVAISGNTIAIGAPSDDLQDLADPVFSLNRAGAVYVFVWNGTTWSQQARLTASNRDDRDGFGTRVAISGDTIVASATGEDSSSTGVNGQINEGASDSGAAYVFNRSGTTWSETAFLKASNAAADDLFGTSLSLETDTLVVGARGEDSAATGAGGNQSDDSVQDAGAAYVFKRTAGQWSQDAYLKPSNTRFNFVFGVSVAISGDTVAVGAPGEDGNATGVGGNQSSTGFGSAGAAYVFTRSGSTWTPQAYVKASNTDAGDGFGVSLTLDGDRLVVGASNESSSASGINGNGADDSLAQAGAAYVYERTSGTWAQRAYVKAAQPNEFAQFGSAVAVSGNRLLVGAPADDVGEIQNVGGADVFRWVDDSTPPATGQVSLLLREGGRIPDAPASISWNAADNSSAAWQLRHTVEIRNRTSSGWSQWRRLAVDQAATQLDVDLVLGKKYEARVRTRDDGGNIGGWSASNTFKAMTQQETQFTLTGGWTSAADSQAMGNRVVRSSRSGANARLSFVGRGVGAVMPTGMPLGEMRICVDKGKAAAVCRTIDLRSYPQGTRRVIGVFNGLPLGTHTLDVTVRNGLVILDGAIIWK